MPKKKAEKQITEDVAVETALSGPGPHTAVPEGVVPGTVRIVNMEPSPKDILLHNGVNVRLAPFSRVGAAHISPPIPKRQIPEAVKKMKTRGWVKLIEEVR